MFGDIGKIMKLASEMKTRMPQMQQELAEKEFAAEAGGGVVTATVNGRMQLTALKIDREIAGDDLEMLEDLVVAAVAAAQTKAAEAAAEMMQEMTGGMNLPPGMEGLLK